MRSLSFILVILSVVLLSACQTKQIAVVRIGDKFGCVNRKGAVVIEPVWDYILQGYKKNEILVAKDSLYGYIDNKGRVLIKPQYKDADLFSEGLAFVSNGEKYGYINLKGDTVIGFQFDENTWGNFSKGYADITINSRSGYIDRKGEVVIPLNFEICYPFRSKIAVVMDTAHELRLVTKSGKILEYNDENIRNRQLLPPRYPYPGSIESDNGQGRVNKNGDTVVPPIYKVTGNLTNGMYIVQNKHDKWGAYNKRGNLIVEPTFDYVSHFSEGLSSFKLNDKWGYINKKGSIVIKPQFDKAGSFESGLAYVEINNNAGFINRKGKFVIEPMFEPNPGSRFE